MGMPRVGPEDTYESEIWVSNDEQEIFTVPSNKYARKVFGLTAIDHSGNATSTFTLRKYSGTTLEKEWTFVLGAYDTLDISRPLEAPFLTVEAGKSLRVVGGAPTSVFLKLDYYDL